MPQKGQPNYHTYIYIHHIYYILYIIYTLFIVSSQDGLNRLKELFFGPERTWQGTGVGCHRANCQSEMGNQHVSIILYLLRLIYDGIAIAMMLWLREPSWFQMFEWAPGALRNLGISLTNDSQMYKTPWKDAVKRSEMIRSRTFLKRNEERMFFHVTRVFLSFPVSG